VEIYLVILRVIHILAGVLWAGWAFASAGFVEPAARAAGPEGGKFMQALAAKTKLTQAMLVAPLLVILSGVLIYLQMSGGLSRDWLVSASGLALTLGALAGILAFILGFVMIRPAADHLAALSGRLQMAGGPPKPEQMAELGIVQRQLYRGGWYGAILLVISVIGMALAGALG
jgi:hypothetical protein